MAITDASGFPVAVSVASASSHEVKLVEKTIDSCLTPYAPGKLIGNKAYDSDSPDQKLMRTFYRVDSAPSSWSKKAQNSRRQEVAAISTQMES